MRDDELWVAEIVDDYRLHALVSILYIEQSLSYFVNTGVEEPILVFIELLCVNDKGGVAHFDLQSLAHGN